jgi:hypothetical protein
LLGWADVVVVTARVTSHVLQLGECLDARVAGADEDEGEGGVADGGVAGGGGDVELFEDVVAQADGLFDGLEADAVLGEAGDGEGAGDGAGGEDEVVVVEVEGLGVRFLAAGEGAYGDGAAFGVGGDGLAGEEAAAVEDAAEGDDDVAGGDVAGGRLGEEGLVRHVRRGADHGDLGLAAPELTPQGALQAVRGVEADVAAADQQDAGGTFHQSMRHPRSAVCPQLRHDAAPFGVRRVRLAGARRFSVVAG